jgi:hypothetical protein
LITDFLNIGFSLGGETRKRPRATKGGNSKKICDVVKQQRGGLNQVKAIIPPLYVNMPLSNRRPASAPMPPDGLLNLTSRRPASAPMPPDGRLSLTSRRPASAPMPTLIPTPEQLKNYVMGQNITFEQATISLDMKTKNVRVIYDCNGNISKFMETTFSDVMSHRGGRRKAVVASLKCKAKNEKNLTRS